MTAIETQTTSEGNHDNEIGIDGIGEFDYTGGGSRLVVAAVGCKMGNRLLREKPREGRLQCLELGLSKLVF